MSLRNRLALPLALSALAMLAACGNNGSGVTNGTAPPTGAFSKSNLNGTYVFSISGTDETAGGPYAAVGVFTANGTGGISGGAVDLNDPVQSTPIADAAISGGSYTVGMDGRGQATLNVSAVGGSLQLDFVLQNSSHGLVSEFDGIASGSGTLDVQTAGVTPTGSYAFLLSGLTTSDSVYGAAGNFMLSGNSLSGLADVSSGGIISYTDEALSGSFAVGPSSTPSTTFSSSNLGGTFDVIAIDASHLKFIEMDQNATLVGDAFSQTSTTMPAGNLAFTMAGCAPCGTTSYTPLALGGFMVSDGNGNITNTSTEDYNVGGTSSTTSGTFSAAYTGGTGRFVIGNFASFVGGSSYVAYPSSGGLLLMEVDSVGFSMGAAYAQQNAATFASGQGYGLNLTGTGFTAGFSGGATPVEVDDIAEFTANSGGTLTGVIDENYAPAGFTNPGIGLSSGTYSAPDANGRGSLSAAASNNNNSTLDGGFTLIYYAVDGTTFPVIEVDQGQIAVGMMVEQNASASAKAAAQPHMFVMPGMMTAHAMLKKQK